MKSPDKIKDFILEHVDLAEVMLEYDVSFVFHPGNADEVQYRCPFHGKDNKPSARYYRHTQTCYCWYCKKSWNVIEFIKEKEVLNYYQALKYIPTKYKLDLSSIPDEPEFVEEKKEKEKVPVLSETDIRMTCVHKALLRMRGKLVFDKYIILCVYFLSLAYRAAGDIQDSLSKLEEKILKAEKWPIS